jgi:hypothetical protein
MAKKQAKTVLSTVEIIMSTASFARGLAEIREGKPFNTSETSWEYERGRQFGAMAPLSMRLFVKGRLNPDAVRLCRAAFERKLLL